jgi:membrane fusion protein, multidrug efflux system
MVLISSAELPSRSRAAAFGLAAIMFMLAGCGAEVSVPPEPARPVLAVTAQSRGEGEITTLAGSVEAKELVSLAFRTGGRMIERLVNVGDQVEAGQVIARLEPASAQNALQMAQSTLAAAEAQYVEASNNYERQQQLVGRGFTTRVNYDAAKQAQQTARSQVEAAQAGLRNAEDQVDYTVLEADGPGIVTARGAEAGEVVTMGQMIVQIARQGGRDAVFDVPGSLVDDTPLDKLVEVSLTQDAKVVAEGRIREVSPEADVVTRTFKIRVGLSNPPEQMRLGSTVSGAFHIGRPAGIEIPAAALTSADGKPAVWVVGTADNTVSLKAVELVSHDLAMVVVGEGLVEGDIVVVAGVQTLRPGQKVRLLGNAQ